MSTPVSTTNATKATVKREFEGVVLTNTEDKTIHVKVESVKVHPKYNKQYVTSKKYAVHDEKNEASVGDRVRFREGRPFSKTKRWYLTAIVKKVA